MLMAFRSCPWAKKILNYNGCKYVVFLMHVTQTISQDGTIVQAFNGALPHTEQNIPVEFLYLLVFGGWN